MLGNFVSGLGTQAALVALPFQVYTQTQSALLTGLLGAAELGPLVVMALLGGALADRIDRRRLLLLDQIALVRAVGRAVRRARSPASRPCCCSTSSAALLAGFGALQNVARTAIVPNLVAREEMPAALAINFGLYQLTMVFGPGLGGLLIAAGGVEGAYAVDAMSCFAMVGALRGLGPQLPAGAAAGEARVRIRRSIADGLRFVRRSPALLGSFAIDLSAMTFGMPRALFPVLAVSVYGAGAAGTGLLFAAVSAGAAIAALTTGWLDAARRLGLITIARGLRVGPRDRGRGARRVAVAGGGAARARGRGRQRQRGVPLGHQPDRDARRDARADVVGVLARRHERPAPRRHRGRRRSRR